MGKKKPAETEYEGDDFGKYLEGREKLKRIFQKYKMSGKNLAPICVDCGYLAREAVVGKIENLGLKGEDAKRICELCGEMESIRLGSGCAF